MIRYQLYKGRIRYKEYHLNKVYDFPKFTRVTYYIR